MGQAFDVQVLGRGGVPSSGSDVLAVVANITVVSPSRAGWLTAYPSGGPEPEASNVNFNPGQTVPNLALLRVGGNGKVRVILRSVDAQAGSAHVLIDVVGWFSTSASGQRGGRLIATTPGRILDTRFGIGRSGALGARSSFALQILGADAKNPNVVDIVPNSAQVSGVILNVTATGPGATTFVSIQPQNFTSYPTTSSLNLVPNQTKANLVMVPVGNDGKIRLYNDAGSVHLIADVVGYYLGGQPEGTRRGRIVPLSSPFRAFDTRKSEHGAARLGPGQAEWWDFNSFIQSVKIDNTWVGEQEALLFNLTATDHGFPYAVPNTDSWLTVHPFNTSLPTASNLNFHPYETVPNFVVARLSADNRVNVYNHNGFVHYLADVAAVVLQD
jgi:hypothetical protein